MELEGYKVDGIHLFFLLRTSLLFVSHHSYRHQTGFTEEEGRAHWYRRIAAQAARIGFSLPSLGMIHLQKEIYLQKI